MRKFNLHDSTVRNVYFEPHKFREIHNDYEIFSALFEINIKIRLILVTLATNPE